MKEPFIKILQRKEQHGEEGVGQLLGFGVIHGVTIGLPEVTGYSIDLEEPLKSNQWKRQTVRTIAVEKLTEKELDRPINEQYAALKQLIANQEISSVSIKVIRQLEELRGGTLDITIDQYFLRQLGHNTETNELFIVVD